MTSNQVIVAGMGTIIGIQHQAIHEYMKMQYDFTRLQYRTVFNRVISFDKITATLREKYKDTNTSGEGGGQNKLPKSDELPT